TEIVLGLLPGPVVVKLHVSQRDIGVGQGRVKVECPRRRCPCLRENVKRGSKTMKAEKGIRIRQAGMSGGQFGIDVDRLLEVLNRLLESVLGLAIPVEFALKEQIVAFQCAACLRG